MLRSSLAERDIPAMTITGIGKKQSNKDRVTNDRCKPLEWQVSISGPHPDRSDNHHNTDHNPQDHVADKPSRKFLVRIFPSPLRALTTGQLDLLLLWILNSWSVHVHYSPEAARLRSLSILDRKSCGESRVTSDDCLQLDHASSLRRNPTRYG